MRKILTIILILVFILTGCGKSIEKTAKENNSRFSILSDSSLNGGNRHIAIIEDNETKCQYIYAYAANNSIGTSITPLYDQQGNHTCKR